MIETMMVRFDARNRVWVADVKNFFLTLPRLLPCQSCANHLVRFNYEHPLMSSLDSQTKFFVWLYQYRKSMGFKYSEREYIQYIYDKFRVSPDEFLATFEKHGAVLTHAFESNASSSSASTPRPRKPCNCRKS